jgi:hypothetical protein
VPETAVLCLSQNYKRHKATKSGVSPLSVPTTVIRGDYTMRLLSMQAAKGFGKAQKAHQDSVSSCINSMDKYMVLAFFY